MSIPTAPVTPSLSVTTAAATATCNHNCPRNTCINKYLLLLSFSGKFYFFHLVRQVSQWSEPEEWGQLKKREEEEEHKWREQMQKWKRDKEDREKQEDRIRLQKLKEKATAFR